MRQDIRAVHIELSCLEKMMDHTFVICAYRESPYLEDCITSLEAQKARSDVMMVTSTPSPFLEEAAMRHGIPLFVNPGKGGLADDWNYALFRANTRLVTITHQDDIYCPEYCETILERAATARKPLILFTDYGEIRNGERVAENRLLRVKRVMLKPFELKCAASNIFVRRRILSFGSPICCPSVTYDKDNLPFPLFQDGFRSNLDWQAWERISKLKGDFLYCPEILMYHRIHEDSETSAVIGGTGRGDEDYQMFCCFWPKWIAYILERFYSKSEDSNQL